MAQCARLLGTIHRNASDNLEVAAVSPDRTLYDTLRLEPYYRYTATQVLEKRPFYDALVAEHLGSRRRSSLVHGDYSRLKNVLVCRGRLILLDHEVGHYGDSGFDLGFGFLTHLSERDPLPAAAARRVRGGGARLLAALRRDRGRGALVRGLEPRAVRHTLGCLLARVARALAIGLLDAVERARQRAVVVVGLMRTRTAADHGRTARPLSWRLGEE